MLKKNIKNEPFVSVTSKNLFLLSSLSKDCNRYCCTKSQAKSEKINEKRLLSWILSVPKLVSKENNNLRIFNELFMAPCMWSKGCAGRQECTEASHVCDQLFWTRRELIIQWDLWTWTEGQERKQWKETCSVRFAQLKFRNKTCVLRWDRLEKLF